MSIARFVEPNLEVLEQGIALLRGLPDEVYRNGSSPASMPAIGPHFRHCIDFYDCFLSGLESAAVDYQARRRIADIERDRKSAIEALVRLRDRLADIGSPERDRAIRVRANGGWAGSTVERELDVLLSHTIHHYALIAFALGLLGREVPPDFGVSPSTLDHWRQEGRPCAR